MLVRRRSSTSEIANVGDQSIEPFADDVERKECTAYRIEYRHMQHLSDNLCGRRHSGKTRVLQTTHRKEQRRDVEDDIVLHAM